MAGSGLSRFRLQLQLLGTEIGGLALFAMLLLALAASGHFIVLPKLQEAIEANHDALSVARIVPDASNARHQMTVRYGEFTARLGDLNERGHYLKTLFREAAEAGVTLSQGDYHTQADTDCACQQLQVILPIRGTYPQIRAFVDAALEKIPSLSLDEISFRRDSVKTPAVEARLRLTLFLKQAD